MRAARVTLLRHGAAAPLSLREPRDSLSKDWPPSLVARLEQFGCLFSFFLFLFSPSLSCLFTLTKLEQPPLFNWSWGPKNLRPRSLGTQTCSRKTTMEDEIGSHQSFGHCLEPDGKTRIRIMDVSFVQPSNGERNLCYVREGIHTSSLPCFWGRLLLDQLDVDTACFLVSACVSRIHGQAAI